ncbi:MAG: hypothetical protein Q8N26_00600 [Myxococcales bacterium]|nr:hypothetical protein [Myxococcales bacterium]
MSAISDAARRAAEARRQAQAEAQRKAAEAAKAAAAAAAAAAKQKAAAAAAKKPDPKAAIALAKQAANKPMASSVRQVFGRDEVSTGVGRALRQKALSTLASPNQLPGIESNSRSFSLAELMRGGKTTAGGATSLRTEVLGDGQANCLEHAVKAAKPGDSVVLLTDTQDAVGHAVVQRRDGTVVDPNRPNEPYTSLRAFQQENPRYGNPASITDVQAEKLLRTPPGPARDALITEAGLDRLAARRVADPPQVTAEYNARATEGATQVQRSYDTAIAAGKTPAEAANAAATTLNELASASTDPEYVRILTEHATPTIRQISEAAGDAARDEGDRDKDLMKDTMGLLAEVGDRGGSAVIARELATALPDDTQLEEVDDALFEHMEAGGQTDLARALHDQLRAQGKTEAARGLADNEHGTDLELLVIREAEAALDDGASAEQVMSQYGDYLTSHVAETVDRNRSEDSAAAMDVLARLSEEGGEQVTNEIATQLATKVPDKSNLQKLDDKLHEFAEEGRAIELSSALVSELSRLGKTEAVSELSDVVLRGLENVTGTYEDARGAREAADQEMQAMLSEFSGVLTPEQQSQFIANYRTEHADVYAAEVAAAEGLDAYLEANGPALDAIAVADPGRADDVVGAYEQLAKSPLPARAVEWAASTMQDGSPTHAAFASQAENIITNIVEPGLPGTLTQYQAEAGGNQQTAMEQFEGLFNDFKTAKGLLEAPGGFADAINDGQAYIDAMKKASTGDTSALEAILKDRNKLQGLSGLNSSIAAAGLVFAVANLPGQSGFDLVQSIGSLGEGGLDLAARAIGSLESSGRLAAGSRLASGATFLQAKILPGLGVALSALSTIDAAADFFREGGGRNAARAISSALTLVGGALTLFPATAPIGLALTIGATVGGFIADQIFGADERKAFDEEQQRLLEPILTDAYGDTEQVREAARQIAFGDLNMNEMLETSGLSPRQFVELMGSVPYSNDRSFPAVIEMFAGQGITGTELLETLKRVEDAGASEVLAMDYLFWQSNSNYSYLTETERKELDAIFLERFREEQLG